MTTNAAAGDVQSAQPVHSLIQDVILTWLQKADFKNIAKIGFDQPLNQLGIDSLGMMDIAAQLERELDRKLNPDVIYELATINDLAEYIGGVSAPIAQNSAERDSKPEPSMPIPARAEPDQLSTSSHASPVARYQLLNRRVNMLKESNQYFFEPEISEHDGSWVTVDGQRMLMLASYDYLGLLSNPMLKGAAIHAINTFGTGHHGARLLAGTTAVHRKLEAQLADLMGTDDSIVFGSGYVTNLSVIAALVGPGDVVIGDQWNHASIVDGCHMSGAEFLIFQHNDMDSLEECLQRSAGQHTLVVVDAVYSMDGDIAPMPEIVQLCRRYNVLLMVDEAHSLGVLGERGRGVQEHFQLHDSDIDIKMGTISKALATSGGFVAACDEIVSYLRHHARGYIFSGALAASQANAAITALDILREEPIRVQRLWKNVKYYAEGLTSLGFDIGDTVSPIVPVMTGDIETTLRMTAFCREAGVLVAPVAYPAVPMDAPRLRTCISAIHSEEDLGLALRVLADAGWDAGLLGKHRTRPR